MLAKRFQMSRASTAGTLPAVGGQRGRVGDRPSGRTLLSENVSVSVHRHLALGASVVGAGAITGLLAAGAGVKNPRPQRA